MRIKSYFAPSVQAAIALARKEFGDGVTLVTSHVASLDNRHLGEYEVVFAIEEVAQEAVAEAPALVFAELVEQALQTPPPMHEHLEDKLEEIQSSLVALGLESSLVRSFMTMLKAVLPITPATPAPDAPNQSHERSDCRPEPINEHPIIDEPAAVVSEPAPPIVDEQLAPSKPKVTVIKSETAPRPFLSLFEAARPEPRFSAAELAFMTSVSSPKEQKA